MAYNRTNRAAAVGEGHELVAASIEVSQSLVRNLRPFMNYQQCLSPSGVRSFSRRVDRSHRAASDANAKAAAVSDALDAVAHPSGDPLLQICPSGNCGDEHVLAPGAAAPATE